MKEAIRQFIEREESAEAIRKETLERWEKYQSAGEAVDHEAGSAWMDTWGTAEERQCPVPKE